MVSLSFFLSFVSVFHLEASFFCFCLEHVSAIGEPTERLPDRLLVVCEAKCQWVAARFFWLFAY